MPVLLLLLLEASHSSATRASSRVTLLVIVFVLCSFMRASRRDHAGVSRSALALVASVVSRGKRPTLPPKSVAAEAAAKAPPLSQLRLRNASRTPLELDFSLRPMELGPATAWFLHGVPQTQILPTLSRSSLKSPRVWAQRMSNSPPQSAISRLVAIGSGIPFRLGTVEVGPPQVETEALIATALKAINRNISEPGCAAP